MKNKRRSILAVTAILSTAVLGLSVANLINNGQFIRGKVFADTDCEWMHYQGTSASNLDDGLREYWICCTHHEISYTKPESANITDASHPTGFLDGIKTDNIHDERIISSWDKTFTCDDIASPIAVIDGTLNNLTTSKNLSHKILSIEPCSEGTRSTWGIRAQFSTGDCGLCFKKEFVDQVFSNTGVAAIEFDAKGDATSTNFRHRTAGKNVVYHSGADGTGLNTNWQTYSYTREMYEADVASTEKSFYFAWGTLNGNRYLYLDNIRPVAHDDKTAVGVSKINFNNAAFPISTNTTDVLLRNAYDYVPIIKVNSANGSNPGIDVAELDSTIKSEGLSSLHLHKTAGSTFYFYPHENFVSASQSHGGLKFDIMSSITISADSFCKYVNRTSAQQKIGVALNANTWTTVTVPFNDMRDALDFDGLFAINTSNAFDLYIDNIRFADESDSPLMNSFEGAQVFSNLLGKERYYESGKPEFLANTDINNTNLRDYGKSNFWINGVSNVSKGTIDSTHVSDGAQSMRIDVKTTGSIFAFYNRSISDSLLPGDKLMFDIYTNASGATFGKAPTADRSVATPLTQNAWTTITLTKTSISQQFFRLNENTLPVGSYWFDNFRVVYGTPSEGFAFESGNVTKLAKEVSYTDQYGNVFKSLADEGILDDIGFDSNIGTNNTQVLKISKAIPGYSSFYVPMAFMNDMTENSTLSFDLYATVAINSIDGANNIQDGMGQKIKGVNYFHPANQWVSYTLRRDQITNDGRFLITLGSSQGIYYFDNIKVNSVDETIDVGSLTTSASENLLINTEHQLNARDTLELDGVMLTDSQYSINGTSITLSSSILTAGEHTLVVRHSKTLYSCEKYTLNFVLTIS